MEKAYDKQQEDSLIDKIILCELYNEVLRNILWSFVKYIMKLIKMFLFISVKTFLFLFYM